MFPAISRVSLFFMLLIHVTAVSAATFDFVRYADGTSAAPENNERGYQTFRASENGIALTARGYILENRRWKFASAYLDHGNAGLAVCAAGLTDSNQCNVSSDDSMSFKKMLWLRFDQIVSLEQVVFRNGQHGTSFKGKFKMTVFSEGSWSRWKNYGLTHIFNTDLIGEAFAFYNPMNSNNKKKQFYLSSLSASSVSAVPIPGSIWLFGSALLGFLALGKKEKRMSI